MTDVERIERLEKVLGTLVVWLWSELGSENVERLLDMLKEESKP